MSEMSLKAQIVGNVQQFNSRCGALVSGPTWDFNDASAGRGVKGDGHEAPSRAPRARLCRPGPARLWEGVCAVRPPPGVTGRLSNTPRAPHKTSFLSALPLYRLFK